MHRVIEAARPKPAASFRSRTPATTAQATAGTAGQTFHTGHGRDIQYPPMSGSSLDAISKRCAKSRSTCVHFSRSLPSNSWWQTMVGWQVLSRSSAAEGAGRRGLATRPPRSTAGNISLAECPSEGAHETSPGGSGCGSRLRRQIGSRFSGRIERSRRNAKQAHECSLDHRRNNAHQSISDEADRHQACRN